MNNKLNKNFEYLKNIVAEATEESQVINDIKVISSIIEEFEESLLQRIHSFNREHFRFIYEVTNKLIFDHIYDKTRIDLLDNPKDIDYKNLEECIEYNSKISNTYSGFVFSDIINSLYSKKIITNDEKDHCLDYKKQSDNALHFIDTVNIKDELKYKLINGKVIINELKYTEALLLLQHTDIVLKIILTAFYDVDLDEEYPFNINQYSDGRESFKVSKDKDKLLNFLGENCSICIVNNNNVKGRINFPKNIEFPNGPFLQCDNDECNAILSVNLNLKGRESYSCEECDSKTAMKKMTVKYNRDRTIEEPPMIKCNECKQHSEVIS